MSGFSGFIYSNKKNIIFIVLITISVSMMFFSDTRSLFILRNIGFSIISPFQIVFKSFENTVEGTMESVSENDRLRMELESARRELFQYRKIIMNFNTIRQENINLKKLLDLKDNMDYEGISAEIIARTPDNYYDTLVINKGSSDDIKENMPVISYANGKKVLVGKTISVTRFASKVLTLQSSKLSVGAIITESNTMCLIKGTNNSLGFADLVFIPKSVEFENGIESIIYTGGESHIYPKGIEIGKIIEFYPSNRYDSFKNAKVKISLDYSTLEYVLVLKNENQR